MTLGDAPLLPFLDSPVWIGVVIPLWQAIRDRTISAGCFDDVVNASHGYIIGDVMYPSKRPIWAMADFSRVRFYSADRPPGIYG